MYAQKHSTDRKMKTVMFSFVELSKICNKLLNYVIGMSVSQMH